MDKLPRERRSENMRRIKSKNTAPELVVRRLVSGLGHRYRLHRKGLPGKPDLAFGPKRKVIFVHGCFWHTHEKCVDGRTPKSNQGYWLPKLTRNITRDKQNIAALEKNGWSVLVIWECETRDEQALTARLREFLGHVAERSLAEYKHSCNHSLLGRMR